MLHPIRCWILIIAPEVSPCIPISRQVAVDRVSNISESKSGPGRMDESMSCAMLMVWSCHQPPRCTGFVYHKAPNPSDRTVLLALLRFHKHNLRPSCLHPK